MHPMPQIRPATGADLDTVCDVLTDAFVTDPVLSWLLPPEVRRQRQRMRATWRFTTRAFLRQHKHVALTEAGAGAALWAPPATWAPSTRQQITQFLPFVRIFGASMGKASRFASEVTSRHPRSPRHWYLYAIGTHTGAQGRGIGSALLQDRLEVLDRDGVPAYLESSNIRNVPLYQRHGFEVTDEVTISGGGPTLWLMWREPGR
jgi:ribosomal protein S18 acetylase RimI-like enzyme